MTSPSRRVALWVVFSLIVARLVGFCNSESARRAFYNELALKLFRKQTWS